MRASLQRVLLRFQMYRDICHSATSPEIKQRKDEDPHQIDEVPVKAGDFDDLVLPFPAREKTAPSDVEVSAKNLSRNDDQEDHADRHVGAVEAGDHEKARPELRRSPG